MNPFVSHKSVTFEHCSTFHVLDDIFIRLRERPPPGLGKQEEHGAGGGHDDPEHQRGEAGAHMAQLHNKWGHCAAHLP